MAYTDEFGNIFGDEEQGSTSSKNTNDGTTNSSSVENQIYYENNGTSSTSTGAQTSGNAGSTIPGKTDNLSNNSNKKAGRRLHNPLGDYSSYTYQISLYMVTPDAYNAFITSGRKDIHAITNVEADSSAAMDIASSNSGVYLIAQSGGINNKADYRAPGFELDYYIENVEIKQAVAMGKSQLSKGGPTNTTDVSFDIIEPFGFSFISKLRLATSHILKESKLPNASSNPFANKQFYVLGVKFLGYDAKGDLITGSDKQFTSYFDINLNEIKFRIDGKAVVYHCTAAGIGEMAGMGLANGRILTDTSATGSTVGQMLDDLKANLNKAQLDYKNNNGFEIPNVYDIKYVGDDQDRIKNSSMVNMKFDADKTKYPALRGTESSITTKDSIDAQANSTKRVLSFKGSGSTSILDAIQSIVKQSGYVQDSIKNLYENVSSPDKDTKQFDVATVDDSLPLKWINVSTEVKNLGYDRQRKDWAYQITYVIQPYDVTVANITQAGKLGAYTGPSKRYDYWFTGKNSEVIRYEMSYNSLYASVAIGNLSEELDKISPIGTMIGHRVNEQRQGQPGIGNESQNSFTNFLNDPDAYASAKLTILGDPDWLMQENQSSLNDVYDKFYGTNGYTVNCNSGQVFIEVDFKEAIDYDNDKGIMDINNNLLFWDYPKEYREGPNKINGIAYMVTDVTSHFRNGKFEQTLGLNADLFTSQLVSGSKATTDSSSNRSENATSNAGAGQGGNADITRMRQQVPVTGGAGQGGSPAITRLRQQVPTSGGAGQGGNADITKLRQQNPVGFTQVPPTQVSQNDNASTPTSNITSSDLSNLDIQIASSPVGSQITSPTGSAVNPTVADDDVAAMAASAPKNNIQSLNTADVGRENNTDISTWI